MNIYNLGLSANNVAKQFAEGFSILTGSRLTIYTPSGYALGRINENNPNQGATFIGGGLSESNSTTWNKIISGNISIIRNIILNDSNNPVEFK